MQRQPEYQLLTWYFADKYCSILGIFRRCFDSIDIYYNVTYDIQYNLYI